ncbi:MAG: hypothetical protein J0I31_13780 [Rhizobiales bacterium]|nr:hypothetical protein [Hyphomicrobiales bacterium]
MPARTDYLICRKAPDAPAGVVYFTGAYDVLAYEPVSGPAERLLTPSVSLLRTEAATYDQAVAELLADILTDFGPAGGVPDAVRWEAVIASITLPAEAL